MGIKPPSTPLIGFQSSRGSRKIEKWSLINYSLFLLYKSQCVRDEEGRLLRDKGRIRERWVRFFRSLLNFKSDMLDANIPKRLPQHPVASALGIEPTEEETATAMKAIANAKAM